MGESVGCNEMCQPFRGNELDGAYVIRFGCFLGGIHRKDKERNGGGRMGWNGVGGVYVLKGEVSI